ncbi:MAG: hypothetical protein Q7J54_05270 [Candidatus Woesearchaeota archaeon]|nr:hypothetical protein [Candidatus Woesearchaeota archaeon]
MKRLIFAILVILLVANVYAQGEQVDWSKEESWTPENIMAHKQEAFTKNPDMAVEKTEGSILVDKDIRQKYFTQGDIGEHITKYPTYAQQHFQPDNLGGEGGKAYLKFKSNGNVEFDGEFENVNVNDKKIQNTQGFSIQDISSFPKGTKIKPNGENGFIVILPNQNANGIVLSGGAEQNINFNQQTGSLEINDRGTIHTVNNRNVAEIVHENGKYKIQMANGDSLVIDNQNGGVFNIEKDKVQMTEGMKIGYKIKDNRVDAKINGKTTLEFRNGGYKITGDFNAITDTKIGMLDVPSIVEDIIGKELSKDAVKKDISLCFKCGEEVSDRAVIIEDSKILVGGKTSVSLEKDGEIIGTGGLVDGVVYAMDDKGVNIVKRPSLDELRGALMDEINEKREDYAKRIKEITGKIAKLKEQDKLSSEDEKHLGFLERTHKTLIKNVEELPKPLTAQEARDIIKNSEEVYEIRGKGRYSVDDFKKYKSDVPLLMAVNLKGSQIYATMLNTRVEEEEYKIYANKIDIFSKQMRVGSKVPIEPIEFGFNVKGKQMWEISDNKLFEVAGKKSKNIDFYTDVNFWVTKNTISFDADVSTMLADLGKKNLPFGAIVEGPLKSYFKDRNIQIGDLAITEQEIVLRTNIEGQRGVINYARNKPEELISKIDPTTIIEQDLANSVRDAVYTADEKGLKSFSDVVDKLAASNMIPGSLASAIKDGTKDSLKELQYSEKLSNIERITGLTATINQEKGNKNEALFNLVLHGIPEDIPIKIKINTRDINLIDETAKHVGMVNQQKSITDVFRILVESDVKNKMMEIGS